MSDASFAAVLSGLAVGSLAGGIGSAIRRPVPRGSARRHRRGLLARIGASAIGRRGRRDRLQALLAATDAGWTVDELVGARVLGAGIGLAAGATSPMPPVAPLLALLAWRAPEIVLARLVRRRASAASREVPLFLDLLAVATSAGLAPQLALRLAAEPLEGPLGFELRETIRRVDLGRRWRDELGSLAERLALGDLRRAAAVLGRSEALGTSLADETARLASDVREGRRAHATERARTAPVKMLFPLVFLILPAFLLLTVVPVLLSTVRSIG